MAKEFLLPVMGILSYPQLFSPRPPAEGADPRYSAVFVFTKEAQQTPEFQALRKGVFDVAQAEWGSDLPSNIKWPFRNCSEKADKGAPYDTYKDGGIFISPWSKNRPGVVDPSLNEILVPSDVWAGQLARAKVSPFAWNHRSGGKGVSLSLGNVQITNLDMPRIGGAPAKPAGEDFDALAAAAGGAAEVAEEDGLPF